MSSSPFLEGDDGDRRTALVESPKRNGIDHIEVGVEDWADQEVLRLHFIKPPSDDLKSELTSDPRSITVTGGRTVRNLTILAVEPDPTGNHLLLFLDRPGDFSDYTLRVDSTHLDPEYNTVGFNFKAGCPSRFDCRSRAVSTPTPAPAPRIDYEAKDYDSFRAALLERLRVLVPERDEEHAADLLVTLVELLAHAGDHLSYYQDAVANEAFLDTARQRVSVRRHARLVDYEVDEGASARTFLHIAVADAPGTHGRSLPRGTQVASRVRLSDRPDPGSLVQGELSKRILEAAEAVFETSEDIALHPALNEIPLYTWDRDPCSLRAGATQADLDRDLAGILEPGSLLLLEEVMGPDTGLAADADPAHRQIVRVRDVGVIKDPLHDDPHKPGTPRPVTRVTWDPADALRFPLPIITRDNQGNRVSGATVARGNLVPADHGRTVEDEVHTLPSPAPRGRLRTAPRIRLERGPLTRTSAPPSGNHPPSLPVAALLADAAPLARPAVSVGLEKAPPPGSLPVEDRWMPGDLLAARAYDRVVAVEEDGRGHTILRFGDDELGLAPHDGATLHVQYRLGAGTVGNVGADALVHLIQPEGAALPPLAAGPRPVRNPLPAWGGRDPESMEAVRQRTPHAFRADRKRAVTEEDYAAVAALHPEVRHAVARFRWTGSWHTVFVRADPEGRSDLDEGLARRVKSWVERFTQAGYDVQARPPLHVPVHLDLRVCIEPGHLAGDVEKDLLDALGNGLDRHGRKGFFHPDRLTFGQPLYASRIHAAAEAVAGVASVRVTALHRVDEGPRGELEAGVLEVGEREIVRLDNDPDASGNGSLRIHVPEAWP